MRGIRANMLPIGMEFKPTGEQLIEAYLLPRAKGEKLEWNGIVEKQMYGENSPCEPWKVFSDIESSYHWKTEEKGAIKYTIHAFTTLLRASNAKRVSRTAGKGTWAGQTGPKKIQNSETGCVIGQSKMFVYGNSGEGDVGHWTMHEYCLSGESVKKSGRSNAADFVVCKVTKKVQKKPSDANKFLSPFANPGVDQVAQSDERHALTQPLVDANKSLSMANEVSFANYGFDYYGGYELPIGPSEMSYPRISDGSTVLPYSGGYEAPPPVPVPVPVPIPASPIVSTKRAAEVDLRNEEDSESDCFKIQKCEGNEFSDALDELKKLEDMFASKYSNQFSPF